MPAWLPHHDTVVGLLGVLGVVGIGLVIAYLVGRSIGAGLLKRPGRRPPAHEAPSAAPRTTGFQTAPAHKNHEWNPER